MALRRLTWDDAKGIRNARPPRQAVPAGWRRLTPNSRPSSQLPLRLSTFCTTAWRDDWAGPEGSSNRPARSRTRAGQCPRATAHTCQTGPGNPAAPACDASGRGRASSPGRPFGYPGTRRGPGSRPRCQSMASRRIAHLCPQTRAAPARAQGTRGDALWAPAQRYGVVVNSKRDAGKTGRPPSENCLQRMKDALAGWMGDWTDMAPGTARRCSTPAGAPHRVPGTG